MTGLPFTDARSAKDWLILLPLINTPVAHTELRLALSALAESEVSVLESLKALEILRESVHDVQGAQMREYAAKPLPLAESEETQWQYACDLWDALANNYARCWQAAVADDSVIKEHQALLAERTLRCLGLLARCYYVVGKKVPSPLWQKIFTYYRQAEQQDVADKKVKDSLLAVGDITTVQAAFIHTLLLSAANPNQHTLRRLLWIDQQLELFSTRSHIALQAPALPGKTPLQIDFAAPGGPQRIGQPLLGPDIREIDTLALAQVLSKRIKLLRQGELPEKLGLGKDFGLELTIELLLDLYRLWCEQGTDRAIRETRSRTVPVILGFAAQFRYVMDGNYQPSPAEALHVGSREMINLHLFGELAPAPQSTLQTLPPVELWDVVNETAQGLRLSRAMHNGERISLNQLMVVKSSARYLAGVVRWLEESDGYLHMGLMLLPGLPQSAEVRPVETARASAAFTEVIWLPAMAMLKAPDSILLPNGWFRAGRQCEIWNGKKLLKIKLVSLIEYGCNFERVLFTELKF